MSPLRTYGKAFFVNEISLHDEAGVPVASWQLHSPADDPRAAFLKERQNGGVRDERAASVGTAPDAARRTELFRAGEPGSHVAIPL